ncbi:MAG: hypothetical protein AB1817_01425 [Chloroflexota bacterium]
MSVLETVNNPDAIVPGWRGELLALKHFPETPITEKDMVVAYREASTRDGFVITALLTSRAEKVKARGMIWQRQ